VARAARLISFILYPRIFSWECMRLSIEVIYKPAPIRAYSSMPLWSGSSNFVYGHIGPTLVYG